MATSSFAVTPADYPLLMQRLGDVIDLSSPRRNAIVYDSASTLTVPDAFGPTVANILADPAWRVTATKKLLIAYAALRRGQGATRGPVGASIALLTGDAAQTQICQRKEAFASGANP